MFYILCAIILVMVARQSKAQPSKMPMIDTVKVHDTVGVPVLLFQSYDTLARIYITRSNKPVLKPCFIVREGFKQNGPRGLEWIEEPQVKAIYSKRWKLIPEKKIQKIL